MTEQTQVSEGVNSNKTNYVQVLALPLAIVFAAIIYGMTASPTLMMVFLGVGSVVVWLAVSFILLGIIFAALSNISQGFAYFVCTGVFITTVIFVGDGAESLNSFLIESAGIFLYGIFLMLVFGILGGVITAMVMGLDVVKEKCSLAFSGLKNRFFGKKKEVIN